MADATTVQSLRGMFPFLHEELLSVFIDGFVEFDDVELAKARMRASSAYESQFAGNRRPDGTVRFSEAEYVSYHEQFRSSLASINVNPYLFEGRFVELIRGDVSVEEFADRLDSIYERVIDAAPLIRQAYATQGGIELSDSAIMASALDPQVGRAISEKKISMAEVSGEAALRGFGIDFDMSETLVRQGINRERAQQVFGQAAQSLPILDVLARRHADPDDDFDINEFLSAAIFDDPEERQRIRRLVAQEKGLFTQGRYAQTQGGELTGLIAR